jgi:hypothetical protein
MASLHMLMSNLEGVEKMFVDSVECAEKSKFSPNKSLSS